jgi:hypothetical protein
VLPLAKPLVRFRVTVPVAQLVEVVGVEYVATAPVAPGTALTVTLAGQVMPIAEFTVTLKQQLCVLPQPSVAE